MLEDDGWLIIGSLVYETLIKNMVTQGLYDRLCSSGSQSLSAVGRCEREGSTYIWRMPNRTEINVVDLGTYTYRSHSTFVPITI